MKRIASWKNQIYEFDFMKGKCIYCGNDGNTGDHVPSKVFYHMTKNINTPKVCCCRECNDRFSRDEEFVAFSIDWLSNKLQDTPLKTKTLQYLDFHGCHAFDAIKESVKNINDLSNNERFQVVFEKLAAGHLWIDRQLLTIGVAPSISFEQSNMFSGNSIDLLDAIDDINLGDVNAIMEISSEDGEPEKQIAMRINEYEQEGADYKYCISESKDGWLVEIIIRNFLKANLFYAVSDIYQQQIS